MKKIMLLPLLFLFSMWSYGQYNFPAIQGPINVPGATPVLVNVNDVANTANVPSGFYDKFAVTVDWANGYNAYSSEADLTVNTTGGSVTIDPPTSGSLNSGDSVTLTFSGSFTGLYNPSVDGLLTLNLHQSWANSDADWSNIVVTLFEVPTCYEPLDLAATITTMGTADISWTAS